MARRTGTKRKQASAPKGLPEDMEDEIDAFHKSKDIVSLDPEAGTSVSYSAGACHLAGRHFTLQLSSSCTCRTRRLKRMLRACTTSARTRTPLKKARIRTVRAAAAGWPSVSANCCYVCPPPLLEPDVKVKHDQRLLSSVSSAPNLRPRAKRECQLLMCLLLSLA